MVTIRYHHHQFLSQPEKPTGLSTAPPPIFFTTSHMLTDTNRKAPVLINTSFILPFQPCTMFRKAFSVLSWVPVGIAFGEVVGTVMMVDGYSMQPTLNPKG